MIHLPKTKMVGPTMFTSLQAMIGGNSVSECKLLAAITDQPNDTASCRGRGTIMIFSRSISKMLDNGSINLYHQDRVNAGTTYLQHTSDIQNGIHADMFHCSCTGFTNNRRQKTAIEMLKDEPNKSSSWL